LETKSDRGTKLAVFKIKKKTVRLSARICNEELVGDREYMIEC